MKTITIETKRDITIQKGTVIPLFHPCDHPIGYDIFIPAQSRLIERGSFYYLTTKNKDGTFNHTPQNGTVFRFICEEAIAQGSEKIITEDNLKVFKMFALITENRIIPEEDNYITSFEAETIEAAAIKAKEYIESFNLGRKFQYKIRL